jgi:hypothetical protein
MAKSKQQRGKGARASAPVPGKPAEFFVPGIGGEQPTDPLRAFPADPPQRNRKLLIVSAILFAIWFCYLAYVALAA